MAERGYKGPSYLEIVQAGDAVIQQTANVASLRDQTQVVEVLDNIGEFRSKYGQTISGLLKRMKSGNLPDSIDEDMVGKLVELRTTVLDKDDRESAFFRTVSHYKDISDNLTDMELKANLEEALRASYHEAGLAFKDSDLQEVFDRDFNFGTLRDRGAEIKAARISAKPVATITIVDTPTDSFTRMDDNIKSRFLSSTDNREALIEAVLHHLGFSSWDKRDFGLIAHVKLPSVIRKNPHKMERLFLPQSPVFRTSVVIGNSLTCSICHRSLIGHFVNKTVLEHRITYKDIVAQSLTGGNTYDNLFPAHDTCNGIRSDRTFMHWSRSSNPKDLAINSEAFKLTSGIDESDLSVGGAVQAANTLLEYAYYTSFRTMSASEAAAKAIPYLARNDEEGNHIRQGRGHWTALTGSDEVYYFEKSTIAQEVQEEVNKVGRLQASGRRQTEIGQTTLAYEEILRTMTGPLEHQVKDIVAAIKTIHETTITLKDKATGKETTKKIKVVHR